MNTTYRGFFKAQRGLRHDDPLSPYLFIMMEEIISYMLKKTLKDNQIGHYFHPRGCPLGISHSLC